MEEKGLIFMDVMEMYENTLKRCENLEKQVLLLEETNKKLGEKIDILKTENKILLKHIAANGVSYNTEYTDEL